MILNIAYTVPVQVIVDTETKQVQRVVVIDEAIERDPDGYCEVQENRHDATFFNYRPATDDEAQAGYEAADEDDPEWPSWDFGW